MARREKASRVSEKTINRSKKLTLLELGEGRFAVSSNSKPDSGYLVTIKDGCNCKGFQHRDDCAHMKKVEFFLEEKKKS